MRGRRVPSRRVEGVRIIIDAPQLHYVGDVRTQEGVFVNGVIGNGAIDKTGKRMYYFFTR